MSFIMQRYKCSKCGDIVQVALGTFGYGMPEKCSNGHRALEFYKDGWDIDYGQKGKSDTIKK